MHDKMLAFHFDLKHAMWSEAYMERLAETLAAWGYNAIVYEVEDKFRHPRHPAVAHEDALSPEETSRRMEMLRRHGFGIIPLTQSLGHAEYVLSNPGYAHLRESPELGSQYDPLSDESRAMVCELIDDLIEAVKPEEYYHIGGDETWNLGKSEKCRAIVEKNGVGGLYLGHMLPIIRHVIKRGLRPVLWADIALTHPEIIDSLPRELVLMDWDYWTDAERYPALWVWGRGRLGWPEYQASVREGKIKPEFIKLLEKYAVDDQTAKDGSFIGFPYTNALRDMGFDVIVAPATRCFGDSCGIPLNTVHLGNCFAGAAKGRASGLGSCITSWAVRRSHPEVNLPGAFAASAGHAGSGKFDFDQVAAAFGETHYGLSMPGFPQALKSAGAVVPWCEANDIPAPGKEMEAISNLLKKTE